MGEAFREEAAQGAALRIEQWAGEVRVNLVRLAAIAAFYGHHLVNYYALRAELPVSFHVTASAIAFAWLAAALGLHTVLSRRWNPGWLRFAVVCFDALMITAILLVADGPRSALLFLPFLLIATAALRLDLKLVWTATLAAVAAYAILSGHAKWVRPEWRVPRAQQVMVVLGLCCAGLLAGQAVRQAKRFARGLADRMKPEAKS